MDSQGIAASLETLVVGGIADSNTTPPKLQTPESNKARIEKLNEYKSTLYDVLLNLKSLETIVLPRVEVCLESEHLFVQCVQAFQTIMTEYKDSVEGVSKDLDKVAEFLQQHNPPEQDLTAQMNK